MICIRLSPKVCRSISCNSLPQRAIYYCMRNSVQSLFIRWKSTCWVFDDPRFGLVDEPFVSDTNKIIDYVIRKVMPVRRAREEGVTLCFSFQAPPRILDATMCVREATEGMWTRYRAVGTGGLTGWLCPALFHYTGKPSTLAWLKQKVFGTRSPRTIYAWVEPDAGTARREAAIRHLSSCGETHHTLGFRKARALLK